MKQIPLTQGQFALVDDEDFDFLMQWRWYYSKSNCDNTGYAVRYENGKGIRMHRVVMNTPANLVVDHINHNGIDNQKHNLRNCTNTENAHNLRHDKRSKRVIVNENVLAVAYQRRSKKARISLRLAVRRECDWNTDVTFYRKRLGLIPLTNLEIAAIKKIDKKLID